MPKMTIRSALALGWIASASASAAVAACTSEAPDNGPSPELPDGSADRRAPPTYLDAGKADGPRSFDPTRYSATCTAKADCALMPIIKECGSCCGVAALRAGEGVADLEAVEAACKDERWACAMLCPSVHAECSDGGCIVCEENPCYPGVLVELPGLPDDSDFAVEVTVDGETTSCSHNGRTSPLGTKCAPGSTLSFSNEGTIWVALETTTATSVTVQTKQGGAEIDTRTVAPAYESQPGPNGPACEPLQCLVAQHPLP
jgi:hypothetical protein